MIFPIPVFPVPGRPSRVIGCSMRVLTLVVVRSFLFSSSNYTTSFLTCSAIRTCLQWPANGAIGMTGTSSRSLLFLLAILQYFFSPLWARWDYLCQLSHSLDPDMASRDLRYISRRIEGTRLMRLGVSYTNVTTLIGSRVRGMCVMRLRWPLIYFVSASCRIQMESVRTALGPPCTGPVLHKQRIRMAIFVATKLKPKPRTTPPLQPTLVQ